MTSFGVGSKQLELGCVFVSIVITSEALANQWSASQKTTKATKQATIAVASKQITFYCLVRTNFRTRGIIVVVVKALDTTRYNSN